MKVAVFHPGTQHSWQTALALQRLEKLAWYATSIFYQPDRLPYRLERWAPRAIARRLSAEFRRFDHPDLDRTLVRTSGVSEWLERAASRMGLNAIAHRLDEWGNRRFVRQLATDMASAERFAVWGFNGSSAETFSLARKYGRPCVLDRTVGDFRAYNAVMAPLREAYGDWFTSAEPPVSASKIEHDDLEYELADFIVCGCDYARMTLSANSPVPRITSKLRTIPYCYDDRLFAPSHLPLSLTKVGPVRFLFVGHLSMRKGVHHALQAIAAFPPSEASLTMVGALAVSKSEFGRFADRVEYYPTVPRSQIPAIMSAHDVLIFPSYFEGSAISLLEALASGMGIIQTRQAGNGATDACGLVIDRPDTELLISAMAEAIADRDRIAGWKKAAQLEAARYNIKSYQMNLASLLDEIDEA